MYGVFSDPHFHKWSQFAHINDVGINSRLGIIIDEVHRLASEVKDAGGRVIVCGGDIFHVRGKISPEVMNPVLELFRELVEGGFEIIAISGNHDLESNSANDLSSAATALRSVGVNVINSTVKTLEVDGYKLSFVPYIDDLEELRQAISIIGASLDDIEEHDLFIHAPVDGVIPGLPDHGLTPEYLAKQGFKRVFAGHYHNHVDFGNGVYSIGATTHQTWGDVGSKAGFLLVDEEEVFYRATHAPKFIDLDPEIEQDEVPLYADGNFVRVTMEIEKESQVAEMREFLIESGAKGVLVNRIKKKSTISRTGATASSGKSVEASVGEYITHKKYKNSSALTKLCGDILSEVEVAE